MEFRNFRFLFLFKIIIVIFLVITLAILSFSKESRRHLFSYFSTRCLDYKQKDFSRKLNDRIVDYSDHAKLGGIKPCKDEKELFRRVSEGRLVKVRSTNRYIIDKLTYSYPFVTPGSKDLLDEIAERLRNKASQKGLKGVKIIVTSMTRKTESIRLLRRNNSNASENSPHLYGNAFDITYKRFIVRKWFQTNCDKKYLKEALAEVLWQLSEEKKCWATYERMQNCFHVVTR